MLPILHLNGYKIANPTVLARIPRDELIALLRGYGYEPLFVDSSSDDHELAHRRLAAALDQALDGIAAIQLAARQDGAEERPALADDRAAHARRAGPGPKQVDGLPVEGTLRAHQVPLAGVRDQPRPPRAARGSGCAATGPRSSSTRAARFVAELARLAPRGERRMSANPHANGGLLLRDLELPDFRDYAVDVQDARRRDRARPRACWAGSCATSSRATPRRSASSGPTRRRRTGSTPSSR